MAGDWIKVRIDLRDDPAVIAIGLALNLSEDEVVGKLVRFWSWANRHTTDGNAPGVTESWVDRYTGVTGFAHAMSSQGWLTVTGTGVEVPNFERHNGSGAKQRAATALRVAEHRSKGGRNGSCNGLSVTDALPKPLPEKRREEIKKTPLTPQGETASPPKKSSAAQKVGPAFEAFWQAYPKKKKKPSAAKAWTAQQITDDMLPAILGAIKVQRATFDWQKQNWRYVPLPASWLNDREWEDHQDAPAPNAAPAINGADQAAYEARIAKQIADTERYLAEEAERERLRKANGGLFGGRLEKLGIVPKPAPAPEPQPEEADDDPDF